MFTKENSIRPLNNSLLKSIARKVPEIVLVQCGDQFGDCECLVIFCLFEQDFHEVEQLHTLVG